MEKTVLAAASYEKQKYFLEKKFEALPESIRDEVKIICVMLAQKLCCTFVMGFDAEGSLYFETVKREDDFDFDEIGAELEIKQLRQREKELLKALELWYRVFLTEEGEELKAQLLEMQAEKEKRENSQK